MAGLEKAIVVVNEDECKGCNLCVEICPEDVLLIEKHFNVMGFHPAGYVGDGCTGCGQCFYQCPEPGAIAVYKKGYVAEEEEG